MTPLLVLVASLLAQAPALAPAPAVAAKAEIDVAALLEPIRAKADLPGLVAAIVDRDGVVAIGACGVRERGRDARMTAEDRMHLGSCTKSMTATVCAQLVDAGTLAWTTTVAEHFADWGDGVDAAWKGVTLEQLLAHRSGVAGQVEPKLWAKLFTSKDAPRAQREQLARATFAAPPAHAPGTRYEYSNTGIAIAGLMAERAAKKDFEELARDALFTPLGMASAGFGPPGKKGELDQPIGHRADGRAVGLGAGADNPPAIAPAGRAHMALGDWAKYAALHLRGEKDGGLGITPATFTRMHTPPDAHESYALGWGVAQRPWGGRVLTHSGSNTYWFCVAWLAPEKGFGVLVATNQGGDAAQKACDEASSALIGAWTKRAKEPK